LLLAVSSALWSSRSSAECRSPKRPDSPLRVQPSFRVLQQALAVLPQQASSSHGLLLPFSTCQPRKSTGPARFHTHLRSACRVSTLLTAYSFRSLVSLVSCSQHSWALPLRSIHPSPWLRRVSTTECPPAVPSTTDAGGNLPHGAADRSSWATDHRKRPWLLDAPEHTLTKWLPWGSPFQGSTACWPWSPFEDSPLLRLAQIDLLVVAFDLVRVSESQSANHWKRNSLQAVHSTSTLLGFLHLSGPQHLDLRTPGYAFTSSAGAHYCHPSLNLWCAYV
jgi:hypothetical protein